MVKSLLNGPEMKAAVKAAVKAGSAVIKIYYKDFSVERKADDQPVCAADLASNRLINKTLKPLGYPILSEESFDDLIRLKSKKVWIVDPLDGTSDFVNKKGEFTIMIGLVEAGRPVLGVVYSPAEKILYYAAEGEGAFEKKGGKTARLSVSNKKELAQAKIYISRYHFGEAEKKFLKLSKPKKLVACGSSKKLCLIAAGRGEASFNLSDKTKEWDVCAAAVILSEAGGRLTDKNGANLKYNKKQPRNLAGYVAGNFPIHEKIIAKLKRFKAEI